MKLLSVYTDTALKALKDVFKNWVILPGIVVCYIAFQWIAMASQPLGFAGGFLVGAAAVAGIALYYLWLRRTIDGDTLKFKDLIDFEGELFFQVMSIAFLFFIFLDLLLGSFAESSGDPTVLLVAQLAAFLMFNAIPEMIYQQRVQGVDGLVETFNFIKDNWIEWFLPLVVILGPPLYLLSHQFMITALAISQPLIPFQLILTTWPFSPFSVSFGWIGPILDQLPALFLCHWFMLFRGHLFKAIQRGRIKRS